jgi:hypothetical protein
VSSSLDMPTLAQKANEAHRKAAETAKAAIEYARECGSYLIEAKELCGHGNWLSWLSDNFEGSHRTANRYMTIARNWREITAKSDTVSDLTMTQALKPEPKTKLRGWLLCNTEEIGRACTLCFDVLSDLTLTLDAKGFSAEEIAKRLGVPDEWVVKVLYPEYQGWMVHQFKAFAYERAAWIICESQGHYPEVKETLLARARQHSLMRDRLMPGRWGFGNGLDAWMDELNKTRWALGIDLDDTVKLASHG